MGSVIQVDRLAFAYRGEAVLRDLSFQVGEGEFVGLTGSNGAGKSTLLRLILGELTPDQGEIRLFGQPVKAFRQWPMVGYVPQGGAGLAEGFPATAAEVVTMGLYSKIGPLRLPGKAYQKRALEALATVGMEEHAGRMVGQLSGGQVQRVLVARALAGDSRLLVLDEPATGVDAHAASDLYRLLKGLAGEGIAVMMVTHDRAGTAPYLTRTLHLEGGRVVVGE